MVKRILRQELRKSIAAVLSATMIASMLITPAAAAEVSENAATEEVSTSVSSDDAEESSSSNSSEETTDESVSSDEVISVASTDSDTVDTQSTNSRVRGYTLSMNSYFYTYTGSYISPAVTLSYAGEKVASISSGASSGTTVSNNGWYFYFENNKKKGTAAVIAYKGTDVVTQTFKIMSSSSLKLSKTKVFGVEQRETGSLSQDDARLYYYDDDTEHYYPLTEGVDYTKSVTSLSSKKGRVTFTAAGVWSGSKKASFKMNTSSKKLFADPSNITVSMTYVYNSNTYSLDNLEDVEYTGSAIKPEVTLTSSDGTTLTSGTDYKVSYKNNKKPGIATVTISLKGSAKSTYTGKIVKYFVINPIQLTPKYEYYVVTSGTLLRHTNSGGNSYILDYDGDTDYYYTYTGSQVIPQLRVNYDGSTWTRANTAKRCVTYSINATSKRSKTKSSPPTAYVFGKGTYGGYAGSVTFTIRTSGDDSD